MSSATVIFPLPFVCVYRKQNTVYESHNEIQSGRPGMVHVPEPSALRQGDLCLYQGDRKESVLNQLPDQP